MRYLNRSTSTDCVVARLSQVSIGIDPYSVFKDADWALMIGAKPRGPGMERADLLNLNGEIFQAQVCAPRVGGMPLAPR